MTRDRNRQLEAWLVGIGVVLAIVAMAYVATSEQFKRGLLELRRNDVIEIGVIAHTITPDTLIALQPLLFGSFDAVGDSAIVCAAFQRRDGALGVLEPALVVRRINATRLRSYDRPGALALCEPLLQTRGISITTRELRRVERWRVNGRAKPRA